MHDDRYDVRLEVGDETRPSPAETASGASPFHLLVLGDFSGRAHRGDAGGPPLEDRAPIAVDRDDLDRALAELGPELRLDMPGGDGAIRARFERLGDFHPDRLVRRLEPFRELAGVLEELAAGGRDPDGPAARRGGDGEHRAADDGSDGEPGAADAGPAGEEDAPDGGDGPAGGGRGGGLLDQVLEETGGSPAEAGDGAGSRRADAPPTSDDDAFSAWVRDLVRPHLVEEEGLDAGERALRDRVEDALQEGMAALLHHPAFQALESAWRGLSFLVRRVRTGPELKIRVLDVSRDELARDLERTAGGGDGVLARRLVEERAGTPGAEPWSLIVGLYAFGPRDAGLLARAGALARAAGAPLLAGASPGLAGLPSFERRPDRGDWSEPGGGEAWARLRASDVAPWLGLALPRFLLRLPYGPDDAPCDAFPFREAASPPRHGDYLWGNPALLCAALLAESWSRDGRDMRPGSRREVDRLPLHLYPADGGTEALPCAEMLMSDAVASELMSRGFVPVASVRERGAARVARFQSIADPPTALRGRWS